MKNHKKIYYVPGTLTLILLPVFCYFYLKQFIKSERVIETTVFEVYRPHLDEDCSRRFDTSMLSGPLIKRNYATIELTGGANLDKDKLKSFQENLEKIYKMKDTVKGVHLIFGDKTKYKNFIEAINICYQCDTFPRYGVYRSNLWAAYWPTTNEQREMSRVNLKRRIEEDKGKKEILSTTNFDFLNDKINITKGFILVVMFLTLSYFSIKKMIK